MSNLKYFIDGSGRWLNHWDCTGHDTALFVLSSIGCIWMVFEYMLYSKRTIKAVKFAKESSDASHKKRLGWVFAFCGIIHLMVTLIAWWIPIYYIIAVAFFVNAFAARLLNSSKYQLLAEQEY